MDPATQRQRLAAARVGHLATVTPDDRPHVVACCFALEGDRVWTAVDRKPKTTRRLQRLANVRANPLRPTPWASLLVDHYSEDWSLLWWVRVDGPVAVLESGSQYDRALLALAEKYPQYRAAPPDGPVIGITAQRWRAWAAA